MPLSPRPVAINRQGPRTGLAAHSDQLNFILVCHVGLRVPAGCRFDMIGDGDGCGPRSSREWAPGRLCVADTSFVHRTTNEHPSESRYVAHFSVWHPDLTAAERSGIAAVHEALRAYEAVIAALTQAQLAAPLADDIARDAFARAGRDGVCRSLARARASSSEVATKLALRLAPPWRSALRLAARAVDAGADVRQAAAFARARAADNYGAFRALDAIGRDAIASTSIADAAAALDVVSALSRKAVEWRRADAAGARAFGAVCVAIVRSAARRRVRSRIAA